MTWDRNNNGRLRFIPVNNTAQNHVSVKTENTKYRLALYLCDSKENAT